MPSVAFATYQQSPQLSDDDRLVADVLGRRGVVVHPAVWDAPDVDWPGFDLVVIRSTWDYHLKPGLYAQWLRSFIPAAHRLWNAPAVVLGNLNKRYLVELTKSGVNVVPTAYIGGGDGQRLRTVIQRSGWDEVVVKPAISASGHGAWRSSLAAAAGDQERFADQAQAHEMLVQPYLPEVASRGEWSMVFFDGTYSHAVLKKPADGDFRVQEHFGGKPEAAVPTARFVDQASAILSKIGAPLLYARVDGIERDGDFLLMELEVNEPYLFLSLSDGAATRFADAIVHVLSDAVWRVSPRGRRGRGPGS